MSGIAKMTDLNNKPLIRALPVVIPLFFTTISPLLNKLMTYLRTGTLQSCVRRCSDEGSLNKPEHHPPRRNRFLLSLSSEKFLSLLARRKWRSLVARSSPKRSGNADRTHSRSARRAEGQLFPRLRPLFPLFVSSQDMCCFGKKAALKSSCSHAVHTKEVFVASLQPNHV